jgi:hypothetical protein
MISITYYNINEKLKNNIKNTRIFRRSKISSDHILVEGKFYFRKRIIHNKRTKYNNLVHKSQFRTHLLEHGNTVTLSKTDWRTKLNQLQTTWKPTG